MKRTFNLALLSLVAASTFVAHRAFALSEALTEPRVFFPRTYDTNRAQQIESVLLREKSNSWLG